MDDRLDHLEQVRQRRRFATLGLLGFVAIVAGAALLVRSLTTPAGTTVAPAPGRAMSAIDAQAALSGARQYLRDGEPGKAEAILQEVIASAPTDQDAHILMGEALLGLERPRDSYEQYIRALAIGPEHAELHFAAAAVANTAGLPDRAEEHYWKAQSLDPTNPKHPLYLAQIQRKLGRNDEAKASLLRATLLEPGLAIAWGVLADLALEENKVSLARQHIAKARAIEPANTRWRLIEARVLRRDNDPQSAVRLLRSLPDEELLADPNLLAEAAACYAMLSRPDDAAGLFMMASSRRPEDADLAYDAALWLDRAGRPGDAQVFAVAAANRGHQKARELLDNLRRAPR
ncbi:MAG: tetratricopeptide repeat protein [Phycisphaerales bacterium]|nr:tetratricopeptide repeat protein [Phycisphaerales bacterium]